MVKSFGALSTQFIFGNAQFPQANLTVSTQLDKQLNPTSLSFRCSRLSSWVDSRISTIFNNAIEGQAHLDFDKTQNPVCQAHEEKNHCGNTRGYLAECRCSILDRVYHPHIRKEYEEEVINAVFTILPKIPSKDGFFHLKLGIFCSGWLLGEEILLFRLLDKLSKSNKYGNIELFLIDYEYKNAIKESRHVGKLEDAVGKTKYIEQFLIEISECLPKNITVEGTFFDCSENYIDKAKADPNFRHHLLIGADIEESNLDMGTIGRETGLGITQPIALLKVKAIPQVCQLDLFGGLENCYQPVNPVDDTRKQQASNDNHDLRNGLIAVAILATLLVTAYLLLRNFKSTQSE